MFGVPVIPEMCTQEACLTLVRFSFLFPRGPNPSKVLQQLLVLQPEQQLSIFNTLRNHLREKGMLPPAVEEAQ